MCLGPLFVGCDSRSDNAEHGPPPPTEVRHDLQPLTARFPALERPAAASWVTWNSVVPSDRSVPGPTTYWIDAVVEVAPATTTALVARYSPQPGGDRPDVQELLRSALPAGPFLSGAALDTAFTTPQLATVAYLDPTANVLVLMSTGM